MRISVRVKPGTKGATRLEKQEDGSYVAFLQARAHGGLANRALIELLSDELHVPKSRIQVVQGARARQKVVEILE